MTFKDIPISGLFVTGPDRTLFIKLNNEPWVSSLNGGMSLTLDNGRKNWVPANRQASLPTLKDFMALYQRYSWNQLKKQVDKP